VVLAIFSGLLLALSFPRFGQPAFAWIALVPLLAALARERVTGGRSFLLGFLAGLVYFGGTLYWVASVMQTYGGLNWAVSIAVALALVAYLALYPALFALVCRRLIVAFGGAALLLSPAVWVTTELGRAYLLTGFPWVLLGYSQARVLQIAQVASLFGIFGLSALVALVNAVLAYLFFTRSLRARVMAVSVAVVCVVAASAWGTLRIHDGRLVGEGKPLEVGLIQGDVPQDEKWDAARASQIFQRYLQLTHAAATRGARLIVWPESSTPFLFEEDPYVHDTIRGLAVQTGSYILVGSDQIERTRPPKYYNAAFMVGPDGRTLAVYRKIHLVPFGEYVPLKGLLFFAAPLVQAVSDFSAGEQAVLLPYEGYPISTAICFEVVYPELVRQSVLGGSQLLTTITNDAWFGTSSAPDQHFEQASVRAIEEGRYLVRAANTGISGIVDPYGRVLQESRLFEPAVLVGQVRALTGLTLYARIGDTIAYLATLVTLVALGAALVTRRRGAPGT
jgi:apolipoprotein N-acyltransferase